MKEHAIAIVACIFSSAAAGCGERYSYMTYQEVILNGPTTANFNRMYPAEPNKIPNLFVRTPNGDVFKFQELPEAVVSKLEGTRHTQQLGLDQYLCDETMLEYKNGKLTSFSFGQGPLDIGSDRNGPFRGFPMTQNDVQEIFGAPEREGRTSKPTTRWW